MSDFRYYRPDNFPPIVKNLIIINALVYAAQIILHSQFALTYRLALWPVQHPLFEPYQIATHMFTHSLPPAIFHILFNMFGLWMFGKILENVWGSKRFLFFYLVCGVGAAIAHLTIEYFDWQSLLRAGEDPLTLTGPALGASGAVMGIFAAFAYLFPNTELYLYFIPIPVKAKWVILAMAAYDLFGGLYGNDNIAHFAHLGGALTGFILVLIWNKTNKKRFY